MKYILVLLLALTTFSCKKDDDKQATLEVTLSYYYNQYQGYKPDVNASVYLFRDTGKDYEAKYVHYATGGLTIKGSDQKVYSDYSGKTDVNGVATLTGVPYGKYLIVVSGKGRSVYSKKKITVNSEFQK